MVTHPLRFGAALLGAALLVPRAVPAAVVTVTDCAADPHIVVVGKATRLEVGADDLVLHCALTPRPGTDRIFVAGHDVTIESPGSMSSAGKATSSITASGTFTASDTALEVSDANANLDIVAAGNMSFANATVSVGSPSKGGKMLDIHCTGAGCTITATNSSFKARTMEITAVGDVSFADSTIVTNSPIDHIRIVSTMGNVILGAGGGGGGQPDDCCGIPGDGGHSNVISGNEGELDIVAWGLVDLSGSNVLIAQHICIRSGDESPAATDPCTAPCAGGVAAGVPADIDLSGASLRNDFGKDGDIVVCADETRATIDIDGATLIDDDPNAGTNDVSELNACEIAPRTFPPCVNLLGTPAIDS